MKKALLPAFVVLSGIMLVACTQQAAPTDQLPPDQDHRHHHDVSPMGPAEGYDSSPNEAIRQYLASLSLPPTPTLTILDSNPENIVAWFTELDLWTQNVILAPNYLQEQAVPVDDISRDEVKQALESFYTPQAAEHWLSVYWTAAADDDARYVLVRTEGPAILPFMDTVILQSAGPAQVVIHATNPSPSLYEEIIRTYTLITDLESQQFRIDSISLELIR